MKTNKMATVKETYKTRRAEIKQQLKMLEIALSEHAGNFQSNDTSWGYVGDLGHVKSVLSELDGFMKQTK